MPSAAPRTQAERDLADIWAEALGGAQAGICDNFFELGGHSLSLTQLASRIRARFDGKMPLRVLYHAPTIVDMTVAIAEQQPIQADDDESSRMIEELRHLSPEEVTARLASESQVCVCSVAKIASRQESLLRIHVPSGRRS